MPNFYDLLKIDKKSDIQTISKAYKELALRHHSDKGGDDSVMKVINEAY